MKRKPRVTVGSGNVFKDLDLSSPEETLAKADLTARIARLITRRGLTQAATARILGIDQPKVSALLRGRFSGFSTERLMKFLTALGCNVRIVIQDRPRATDPGHLQVTSSP